MFHSGYLLHVDQPQRFTLSIQLIGGDIPANDATPSASPFSFIFYISEDDVLDSSDILISYDASTCAGAMLASGLTGGTTIEVVDRDRGQNH